MKRLLTLLCTLTLCFSLAGCHEAEPEPDAAEDFWAYEPALEELPAEHSGKAASFTLPYLSSQTLDPIACSDGVQQVVGTLLYEGLFALNERFEPEPLLCSTYSRNGLTYTFTLRDGVTFSNGASLTASDVLATYRRAQVSERYSARFVNVASMRAGRGTITITLMQADSALPALLDIPIVKSGTEKDNVPVGTGPYLFLTDTDGPCLVRNENWWSDSSSAPDRIELASAKDADTTVYLFSAQSAHLLTADLLSETTAASLNNVDITDAPTTALLFLGFNARRPALAEPELRVAMNSALDREAMATTLLAGHARAAQFPISPASPLYPADAERSYSAGAYDAALNSLPGEHPTLELTLLVNEENNFKTALAEYLSRQLTAAYVTVTPRELPWNEYLAALESGDFDLWLGEVRLTADWNITALVGTNGRLNYGLFSSPDVDAALRSFLERENTATATALCQQLSAQAPILPLVFKSLSILTPVELIEGVSPTAARPLRHLDQWIFHFSEA